MKYLNDSGLTYLWGKITDAISAVAATAGGGIASIKQALNSTSSEVFNIDNDNSQANAALAIKNNSWKYGVAENASGIYASGKYNHVEGTRHNLQAGNGIHIEGDGVNISLINNQNSVSDTALFGLHVEGYQHGCGVGQGWTANTRASGHIEGSKNQVDMSNPRDGWHVEGNSNLLNKATNAIHVEGSSHTIYTSPANAHVEGCGHYMGSLSQTNGQMNATHIEGYQNKNQGSLGAGGSHIEGYKNKVNNSTDSNLSMQYGAAHIEGHDNEITAGYGTHMEGGHNLASADHSHVEGQYNVVASANQHVEGKYNIADANNEFAHIVGNGTANDARSNAYTLDWSGNGWYQGTVEATGLILKSSTANSDKRFLITVDDSGALTATEIVAS